MPDYQKILKYVMYGRFANAHINKTFRTPSFISHHKAITPQPHPSHLSLCSLHSHPSHRSHYSHSFHRPFPACPPSGVRGPSSLFIRLSSFVPRHSSLVIRLSSFVSLHSSLVIRPSSFAPHHYNKMLIFFV